MSRDLTNRLEQASEAHRSLDEAAIRRIRTLQRALFMCAAHCQGGHSRAGEAAAAALDIPYPITMQALDAKALAEGFDPLDLWSWRFAKSGTIHAAMVRK